MELKQLRNTESIGNILHAMHIRVLTSIRTILNTYYPDGLHLTGLVEEEIEANELNVPSIDEQSLTFIGAYGFKNGCKTVTKYYSLSVNELVDIYDFLCDFVEHDKGIALPNTMAEILLDGQIKADKQSVWEFIDTNYDDCNADCVETIRNKYTNWKNNQA